MTQSFVSDRDVRALLDLTERAVPASSDEVFYSNVLLGLNELIPCWDVTFQLMDLQGHLVWSTYLTDGVVHEDTPASALADENHEFCQEFWAEGGCALPGPNRDYTTVRAESDGDGGLPTNAGWVHRFYYYEQQVRHKVMVPMQPHSLIDRRLLLWRRKDEPNFTERETLMLRLIRPHLAELQQRRHRELTGQPDLTARQWEILRRVSTGATNHEVAGALGVSDATVRKHLENIFLRLNVASRTEAVSRVSPFLAVA